MAYAAIHPGNLVDSYRLSAAGSLDNMARVEPSAGAREALLLGDGDSNPKTTYAAVLKAARSVAATGLTVFVHLAPPGFDWNDVLLGKAEGVEGPPLETLAEFEARIGADAGEPGEAEPIDVQAPEAPPGEPDGPNAPTQQASRKPITATRFVWKDPALIPCRQWLYGRHYIRKFLSMTVAFGGVGKSSLDLAEILAILTGRALLGVTPNERTFGIGTAKIQTTNWTGALSRVA